MHQQPQPRLFSHLGILFLILLTSMSSRFCSGACAIVHLKCFLSSPPPLILACIQQMITPEHNRLTTLSAERSTLVLHDTQQPPPAFSPQFKADLQSAVEACIGLSPKGDCASGQHGPIQEWDVVRIIDLSSTFSAQSVSSMSLFDGDISKWRVLRARNMYGMFEGATSFNGDLSKWDVSSVTDMGSMFFNAATFNGHISKWHVSRVRNMANMFCYANSFNSDVSKWDISSVQNMFGMFWGAASFDGDISKWKVSMVTDMNYMFYQAAMFSGDISKWNVSRVEGMFGMFWAASSFRGDIAEWDVSSVLSMASMFENATSFNSYIFDWDVSTVANMNSMFQNATSFTQKLCGAAWVNSKAIKRNMFNGSSG